MTIQTSLSAISKALKVNFTLNDQIISYDEVFKDTGMLPALARRADQLCSLCLGYGIGVSFDEETQSKVGVRVIFDDVTPDVLRLMCITDVICELMKSSSSSDRTPLDELMYD
jgi:intracellular multiplication protein IcmS